jgi:phenylacetate-CoA ligase
VIRLYKKGYIDNIRVETEARAALYEKGAAILDALSARVADRIGQVVGIKVPVTIVPAGSIPRSVGKAKRVIDEREGVK